MSATPSPGLLLGLLLSMGYAGIFHLWVGRSMRDLAAYMAAALIGFALGNWIGATMEIPLPQVGLLHVIEGTIGAWIGLFIVFLFEQGTEAG